MKRRAIWVLLTCLIVTSLLLASCAKSTTMSTPTSSAMSTTVTSTVANTATTSTTTATTAAVTTTVTSTGHWWDYLGTPIYGGTLVIRTVNTYSNWDPYQGTYGVVAPTGLQTLWQANYTVDPSIWDTSAMGFNWPQYCTGLLAANYTMPNSYTFVVSLRQDVYYWNKAPANGRQFVASDVVYHWNRCLGLGGGFTTPAPFFATSTSYKPLLSVVANDKFTVTFNFQPGTNPLSIMLLMQGSGTTSLDKSYECPEAVALYGNLNDWHNALGTGPYIPTDFVDGSSLTQTANPNYYEHDLRYPQDQLPYITTRKTLIIASDVTAEAAMRVGKIDAYAAMPVQDALNMQKTNPSIVVKLGYPNNELTLDPRVDTAPYNDIRVRTAMQHAINIPLIASTLYQGYAVALPAGLASNQCVAYPYYPYSDWPQSLKDEYAYNPTLAKQMLADAGFPNGFSTNCILENDANQDLHLVVQSELAAIGIKESFTILDKASWTAYVITSHKHDALTARSTGNTGEMVSPFTLFALYTVGHPANTMMVNDPKIQFWYNDSLNAQSVDQVNQDFNAYLQYFPTMHYAISLVEPRTFNMVQPWVGGNPGVGVTGQDVNACWLNESLKN